MSHFSNSESIFEIIGNYPVVDQFDILYSNLQAGTTYDNYITGSLVVKRSVNGKVVLTTPHITASRGLVFSKLLVSQTDHPEAAPSLNQSYGLQPWRERAGIIRNTRLLSGEERYYDSLLPNLSTMVKVPQVSGSLIAYRFGGLTQIYLALGTSGSNFPAGASGFVESFPFEPIFSEISRMKNFAEGFTATNDEDNNTLPTAKSAKTIVVRDLARFGGGSFTTNNGLYWTSYYLDSAGGRINPGVESTDAAKILFGFGDNRTQGPTHYGTSGGTVYTVPAENVPVATLPPRQYTPMYRLYTYGSAGYSLAVSPIIRGWKYGLVNGTPHYTSAVFRRDRYGQFRDMLEQRQIPVTYTDTQNAPLKYENNNFEKPATSPTDQDLVDTKEGTITRPIIVNFVQQTMLDNKELYVKKLPIETWSSNLSLYVTSSLPFFDGVSRNRPEIIVPPNSYSVTSFIDGTGNITLNIG